MSLAEQIEVRSVTPGWEATVTFSPDHAVSAWGATRKRAVKTLITRLDERLDDV